MTNNEAAQSFVSAISRTFPSITAEARIRRKRGHWYSGDPMLSNCTLSIVLFPSPLNDFQSLREVWRQRALRQYTAYRPGDREEATSRSVSFDSCMCWCCRSTASLFVLVLELFSMKKFTRFFEATAHDEQVLFYWPWVASVTSWFQKAQNEKAESLYHSGVGKVVLSAIAM